MANKITRVDSLSTNDYVLIVPETEVSAKMVLKSEAGKIIRFHTFLANVSSNVAFSNASILRVGGGSYGQVLVSNGDGTLFWAIANGVAIQANNFTDLSGSLGNNQYASVHAPAVGTWTQGANTTFTNAVVLGSISSLTITGGTSGQVLSTDGSGNLSWTDDQDTDTKDFPSFTGRLGNTQFSTFQNPKVTLWQQTANTTFYANVDLGHVGNVHIAGGSSGQVLSTDGSGGLSWGNLSPITSFSGLSERIGDDQFRTVQNPKTRTWNQTANTQFTANVNLGHVGNVHITGGVSGRILSTDGSGGLSWVINEIGANGFSDLTGTLGNTQYADNHSPAVDTWTQGANTQFTANVDLGSVDDVHISGGSNGQVLSTDGAGTLSWTNQSGGGGSSLWEQIDRVEFSASSNVVVGGAQTPSDYDAYRLLLLDCIPSTDGAFISLSPSNNGGVSIMSNSIKESGWFRHFNSTGSFTSTGSLSYFNVLAEDTGTANRPMTQIVEVYAPGSSNYKSFSQQVTQAAQNTSKLFTRHVVGWIEDTSAIDSFVASPSTGTISGVLVLLGLKKTVS